MSMNIFRFVGDMSHLVAIVVLIWQLIKTKNARGISLKTQWIYLIVFCTRYLDLFMYFYSLYNMTMKLFYIGSTTLIIVMIQCMEPYKTLYNYDQDSFPMWRYAVIPCSILAMMVHLVGSGMDEFNTWELLWTFSICLEPLAIVPQLLVLRKYRLVENLTGRFVFLLGLYRFLYIINWIYRAHTEAHYRHHYLVYVCGVVQTLLYMDFFYQYCQISRSLKRCCKKVRKTNDDTTTTTTTNDDGDNNESEDDDGDDDVENLIFEVDRKMDTNELSSSSSSSSSSLGLRRGLLDNS